MVVIKINGKHDGCFVCGDLNNPTEHHIRKHGTILSVYLCWKHHQVIHGTALGKKVDGDYLFSAYDLRLVLGYANKYKLFKIGEGKRVRQTLREEIRRRVDEMVKKPKMKLKKKTC